jgi:general secretion pathway protein A
VYYEHFGLHEKPFNMTPDPRFLFLSESHREALAHLVYGIDNRTGFIALTGEVGAGKTTVLRALLAQLDPERYRTALIFNPCLSAPDLLQAINREFHIPADGLGQSALLENLNQFLIRQNEEGRIVVLVIDEAQNLQPEVLEQIRLISNLETEREKLLQIVLAGQPELGQLLGRKDLRQLNQRIVVRYHLRPMTAHDTFLYIKHRLNVAGGKRILSFSREAANKIYRYSGGLPRLVNIASDRTLLAAYTGNTQQITARVAATGIADLKPRRNWLNWKFLAGAGVFTVACAAVFFHLYGQQMIDRSAPPAAAEPTESVAKEPVAQGSMIVKKIAESPAVQPPSRTLETVLARQSEQESARDAFNTLAKAWKIKPVEGTVDLSDARAIDRMALERGMALYRFSGNLGTLLRFDSPAILDLQFPGIPGRRYVALTGMKDGWVLVELSPADTTALPAADLEQHWSGRGLIFWRNPLELPATILPGSSGRHVRELQGLLAQAGTYRGRITGKYDGQTRSAVREFQSAKRIEPDGVVGHKTLILLYRADGRFETTGLSGETR